MKKQQGFTLIELMIVVAVIGVLSAIAIPAYQKYVAKAEVASALATMTGLKTNVEAFTVETGKFPALGDEIELGSPAEMDLGKIEFKTQAKDTGDIVFTFSTTNVSALISGKGFKLTRKSNGSWICQNATAKVPLELLPKSCK